MAAVDEWIHGEKSEEYLTRKRTRDLFGGVVTIDAEGKPRGPDGIKSRILASSTISYCMAAWCGAPARWWSAIPRPRRYTPISAPIAA